MKGSLPVVPESPLKPNFDKLFAFLQKAEEKMSVIIW